MVSNVLGTSKPELDTQAFELYFKALTDSDISIELYSCLQAIHFPDTHSTLRIPFAMPGISDRDLCRISLAHRSLYRSLGTFDFTLHDLQKAVPLQVELRGDRDDGLEHFFYHFGDVQLAKQVFEAVEGLRIDLQLPALYPGLKSLLNNVLVCEQRMRPRFEELSKREAALEFLIRLSLKEQPVELPVQMGETFGAIFTTLKSLSVVSSRTEDSALLTVRLHALISKLPSLGILGPGPVIDLEQAELLCSDALPWPGSWPELARERIEGDDILNLDLPSVRFRGSLEGLFRAAPSASGPDHQAMYRFRVGDDAMSSRQSALNVLEHPGPPEPLPHDHHDVSRALHQHEHGELSRVGPNSFVYPEWDRFAGRYLRNWCRVVVDKPAAAHPNQRTSLALRYSNELRRLRKTMELPLDQAFVTERRMTSGSDVDFDAAVEAMVDLRRGGDVSDAIYLDLRRKRRDIAIALLIDVSASTAQRVEGAGPVSLALSGLTEFDTLLRPPRVLDIEVVSALLCTSALQNMGDAFGIWSFSGTGRERVLLSEIKSFSEPFSGMVVARAAALKPVHATRLGAAVRHCTSVLSRVQAETKVLIVLTDGRPFDVDYGTSYGEDESISYAISDTDAAFGEAKRYGIFPHMLSVDVDVDDYLSSFRNVSIEALTDVKELPETVLKVYLGLANGSDRDRRHSRDQFRKHHTRSSLEGLAST